MKTRVLYLHGFGSGPDSHKGVTLSAHFESLGQRVERLDLRRPSLERLRLAAILDTIQAAIDAAPTPTVLIGSSLGGLAAAHIAEQNPSVRALVLLAPAFGLARHWRSNHPDTVSSWEQAGWLEARDHVSGGMTKVHAEFFRDMERADTRQPTVHQPTLVLHGTLDDTVPIAHSRAFVQDNPSARLVELDDGHELIPSLPQITRASTAFLAPWLALTPS